MVDTDAPTRAHEEEKLPDDDDGGEEGLWVDDDNDQEEEGADEEELPQAFKSSSFGKKTRSVKLSSKNLRGGGGRSGSKRSMNRLSVVSSQFDLGGKGYLTSAEQSARHMADAEGNLDKLGIVGLIKDNKKMRKGIMSLAALSFLLLIGLATTGVRLDKAVSTTGKTTQAKIEESVTTKIESDSMGSAHLVDKTTGNELTVRSEGDTFKAETKLDHTGRKLVCVSLNQVAKMVNDLSSSTQGSLVITDEDGIENEIIPITGKFKDHHDYLQFDVFNITMDDDSCENGAGKHSLIDLSSAIDAIGDLVDEGEDSGSLEDDNENVGDEGDDSGSLEDVNENVGDKGEDSGSLEDANTTLSDSPEEEEESGIFKRRLRNPNLKKKSRPMTQAAPVNDTSDRKAAVLERNRRIYAAAHSAIREGRKLSTDQMVSVSTGTVDVSTSDYENDCLASGSTVSTDDDYNKWHEFRGGLTASSGELTFQVQANNDAHIALGSSSIAYSGGRDIPMHYEIVLGGYSNTQSFIHQKTASNPMATYIGSVLDGSAYRKFRISWDTVGLTVERYLDSSGWEVIMQANHDATTSTYSITRAMVMTGHGGSGWWQLISSSCHLDIIQIFNWRLSQVCTTCSNGSHFSISSSNGKTSRIFREDGTAHDGPRTDFSGFDLASSSGPTWSDEGVQFGNEAVQVGGWRFSQMDAKHLSVTHKNGNVSRVYKSDLTLTLHGNLQSYSGYNREFGKPTCAYLTDRYLQIGEWRFGALDDNHLSVTHQSGNTAVIYTNDGGAHAGPRTDWNAWSLPEGEVIMGSKDGCEDLEDPRFICGVEEPPRVLNDLINPPLDIQNMIAIRTGATWGIGTIGVNMDKNFEELAEENGLVGAMTSAQKECATLQGVMGTEPAIWLKLTKVGQLDGLGQKFFVDMGEEADKKIEASCKRNCGSTSQQKSTSNVPKKAEKSALEQKSQQAPDLLPLCVAVRPCSRNQGASTFGKGVSFGAYFGSLQVQVATYPHEINFKFHGIAASTFGDLEPFTPTAPLWDNYQPNGAHMHIEFEYNTPIGRKDLVIGALELVIKAQVYGEINGQADAGKLMSGLLMGDTPFNEEFKSLVNPSTMLLQMAVDGTVIFKLFLHEIMKWKGFEFELAFTLGGASAMIEWNYVKDRDDLTWIDYRFSASKNVKEGIKKCISDFMKMSPINLGDMVKHMDSFIDSVADSTGIPDGTMQIMTRVYFDGKVDFAFKAPLPLPFGENWCGGYVASVIELINAAEEFYKLIDDNRAFVEKLVPSAGDILNALQPIMDMLGEYKNLIEVICMPQHAYYMQFEIIKNKLTNDKTCIDFAPSKLTFMGKSTTNICMDVIPTCEGPNIANNGKCSKNEDCASGYCLNHETLWTSVACQGTCMEKLDGGDDCSDSAMRSFTGLTGAEHKACKSGKCFCGVCAETDTEKLADGHHCSEISDCEGGYCLGWATVLCNGRCTRKRKEGECCAASCAQDIFAGLPFGAADEFCESGHCLCDTCANSSANLPNGARCGTNDNCSSGYCKGWSTSGCVGKCARKAQIGEDCSTQASQDMIGSLPNLSADDYCESGRCVCNRCAHSYGLPNGFECSENTDCETGWCQGSITANCGGECGDKKRGGYEAYGGHPESCFSEYKICGYCAFSDNKMPGKYRCSSDNDCKTGNCACQYGIAGSCVGCQGYCDRYFGDRDLNKEMVWPYHLGTSFWLINPDGYPVIVSKWDGSMGEYDNAYRPGEGYLRAADSKHLSGNYGYHWRFSDAKGNWGFITNRAINIRISVDGSCGNGQKVTYLFDEMVDVKFQKWKFQSETSEYAKIQSYACQDYCLEIYGRDPKLVPCSSAPLWRAVP